MSVDVIQEVHTGDLLTTMVCQLWEDGAALDVSELTAEGSLAIRMGPKEGTYIEYPAAWKTDGVDGRIRFPTSIVGTGVFTVPGAWWIEAVVTYPSGGKWHSQKKYFEVYDSLTVV